MKGITIFTMVVVIFCLMAVCEVTQAEQTNSPSISNNADITWNELHQAIIFPTKPPEWNIQPPTDEQKEEFHKHIVDAAMVAADKAKAFYLRFPDSTNVIPAKILECQMLERVFNNGGGSQNAVIAWGNAQDALLADTRLTGEDRCDLRLAILHRKQLDHRFDYNSFMQEYEKDLRDLIRDYPKNDGPYDEMLDLRPVLPMKKHVQLSTKSWRFRFQKIIKPKQKAFFDGLMPWENHSTSNSRHWMADGWI